LIQRSRTTEEMRTLRSRTRRPLTRGCCASGSARRRAADGAGGRRPHRRAYAGRAPSGSSSVTFVVTGSGGERAGMIQSIVLPPNGRDGRAALSRIRKDSSFAGFLEPKHVAEKALTAFAIVSRNDCAPVSGHGYGPRAYGFACGRRGTTRKISVYLAVSLAHPTCESPERAPIWPTGSRCLNGKKANE
jgi:hypothetical protein